MKDAFEKSVDNVSSFGDTDIFPFPVENHILFDKKSEFVNLLLKIDSNFRHVLGDYPPTKHDSIVPVGYTGFRWATQIDPLWNAYLLGLVLSIAQPIEDSRVAKAEKIVHSYRLELNATSGELFDTHYNWRTFMDRSIELASRFNYVVVCDIAEFYGRLNHHRLENALKHFNVQGNQPNKIMKVLGSFSGTYSVGIPVGGPASRILAELCLGQIDRLMMLEGVTYCRFADDYHIFCDSQEEAFGKLIFLSEKLLVNQVLQLQKSKTRIMSSREFISTNPLQMPAPQENSDAPASLPEQSQRLMRISLRFDPYSSAPDADFERLRSELKRFDIIGMLQTELLKSRVHIALAKKVISALKFLDPPVRDDAVVTLVDNHELLYPLFSNILLMMRDVYDDLSKDAARSVIDKVSKLIRDDSYVMKIDVHLSYAIRLLSKARSFENEELLNRIFISSNSEIVRRDVILVMARWGAWEWLSDKRLAFRRLSLPERRALLVASFVLKDEGDHWRRHVSAEMSDLESLTKDWAESKKAVTGWQVPL